MALTFDSQIIDKVAVIRCKGRITLGDEVQALEAEVNRQIKIPGTDTNRFKHVVLQLAETDFLDSSGLGSLVRLVGVLRAAGGGLKICQLSPRVLKVIEMTNLTAVFPPYESEAAAIAAFGVSAPAAGERAQSSKTRVVCVDTSKDLLAGLSAMLTRAGYEVLTTRFIGEAATLVSVSRPRVVIFGPGMQSVPATPSTIENFRRTDEHLKILQLASDFYTAEAGEAAQNLISQVQSLAAAAG